MVTRNNFRKGSKFIVISGSEKNYRGIVKEKLSSDYFEGILEGPRGGKLKRFYDISDVRFL